MADPSSKVHNFNIDELDDVADPVRFPSSRVELTHPFMYSFIDAQRHWFYSLNRNVRQARIQRKQSCEEEAEKHQGCSSRQFGTDPQVPTGTTQGQTAASNSHVNLSQQVEDTGGGRELHFFVSCC